MRKIHLYLKQKKSTLFYFKRLDIEMKKNTIIILRNFFFQRLNSIQYYNNTMSDRNDNKKFLKRFDPLMTQFYLLT